jgi:hypothetical protein
VTFVYVPADTPLLANVNAVLDPVDPVPVTSPVNVKDPDGMLTATLLTEVSLPLASTAI